MYLKDHSYGEYIFDWGWSSGARQGGLAYYPKLVSMVPFTPATGRRFLIHPKAEREQVIPALLTGAIRIAQSVDASSVHLLYLNELERREVADFSAGHCGPDGLPAFHPRLSMQYHWHANGDTDFAEYLSRFRSSKRKAVRKERRRVLDAGIDVRVKTGAELTEKDWSNLHRFYVDTCEKKGSYPYLTREFFELAAHTLKNTAVAPFAYDGDQCVAGVLAFEKGPHLYGRYWGADFDLEMLHFELCYYQLIERAIAHGHTRFEAGAQGRHKLSRGLMPSEIHSAHAIFHPGLERAIAAFVRDEAAEVRRSIEWQSHQGPFKRGKAE